MVQNPKISIIVPVYKAENYLHRCVDSIIAQTFKDWELLLVDDGSPDNSGKLCDEYAQKDSRIKVFHKRNGGVSSARQMGLDNATGEYTIHADPDDWVEPTMLEELYAKAIEDNADMVICDYWVDYRNKQIYQSQKTNTLKNEDILKQLLRGKIHGSLCNKLIRRTNYYNYKIKFPPINFCEDLFLVCELLRHNNINVSYLEKAFYHYDQYSNGISISRKTSIMNIDSMCFFIQHFERVLNKEIFQNEIFLLKKRTKELAYDVKKYPSENFKQLYQEINEYYYNTTSFILSKEYIVKLQLLGYHVLSNLINACYNLSIIFIRIIRR